MPLKTISELTAKSSWPLLRDMLANALNPFEFIEAPKEAREEALLKLGLSAENLLGALTYESGGLLIDGGRIRVLSTGGDRLKRNIVDWNMGRAYDAGETPGYMMIADDVIGGLFALNGGELGTDAGNIYYLPPDTLSWEGMDITLQGFFEFCFFADLEDFYAFSLRRDWRELAISGDKVLLYNPPLWEETGRDIEEREYRIIDSAEAYEIFLNANHGLKRSG